MLDGELIIHDGNCRQFQTDKVVAGEWKARGLVPRNYDTHPVGCYAGIKPYHAVDMPVIPRSEWSERCRDSEAQQSRLSDIRLRANGGQGIPARDQNGRGYCWFHSGVSAILLLRAINNLPYVDLSAYAGACVIKNFRDEGGWGAEGVDFLIARGVPTSQFWPQRSVDRANDNPQTWANAALHKVVEGFIDLQAAQYDRNLSFEQNATGWLCCDPTVIDLNWWSHSVCGMDLVDGSAQRHRTRAESGKLASLEEFDLMWGMNHPVTGGFGVRILNSWGDEWSQRGTGILTGNQAIPDGSVALRTTTASLS